MFVKTDAVGLSSFVDTAPEEDTLALKPVELASLEQNPMTKRQLLSNVSKLFDPLGLFAPITIKGRILLQES